MSKRDEERGRFIERLREEGVPEHVTRLVMRHAATLQRYAEEQCNGEGFYFHTREKPLESWLACTRCDERFPRSHVVRTTNKRAVDLWNLPHPGKPWHRDTFMCKPCALEVDVARLLANYKVEPVFQGDPRGAVVKLKVPSGRTDDWGQTGLCVP